MVGEQWWRSSGVGAAVRKQWWESRVEEQWWELGAWSWSLGEVRCDDDDYDELISSELTVWQAVA